MTDRSRLRLVVLGVLVISLVATLVGRLWYLQVLAAPQFDKVANQAQTKDIVTAAPRGEIVDDLGRPMVDNKTALVVSVDRTALLQQPNGGAAVLQRVGALLHVSPKVLANEIRPCGKASDGSIVTAPCWGGSPFEPIPVSQLKPDTASTRQAFEIDEQQEKFPGISIQPEAVLDYPEPDGAQASAVLGYVSQISQAQLDKLPEAERADELNAQVGATGIEASYDSYLRGTPGVKQVTVDHLGGVTGTVTDTQPVAGDDIVTNIDAKAQATLETQLQNAITAARHHGYTADYAAGVVMNVNTGGIVAMASNPTYDPRKPPTAYKSQKAFEKVENSLGTPFVDKAFGSYNAPGSTFKLISSSGLLSDGTMSTGGTYDCPTTFQKRHSFENTTGAGHITLRDALIVSCDTFFFKLGYQDWKNDQARIGAGLKAKEGVQNLAHDYGLGVDPNLDIPGAAVGHIGDRLNTKLNWVANKDNYCKGAQTRPKGSYLQRIDAQDCKAGYIFLPGDQENEDVGQGTVGASPLQMAVAYSALANGGTVYEPRVVKAIMSPTGALIKRIQAPVRGHLPLSKADLDYLRSALYGVTSSTTPQGTATATFANFPQGQVLVGGKTGTAELTGSSHQNGSWFASFAGSAPGQPQYVTVIEVDKSNQGAISAAPYVRNMWESIYGLKGQTAIFPNGVAPTKLPKVGAAAARERAALAQARARLNANASASPSPSTSSSGSASPSSSPSSPSNSPATNAASLPFALPVSLRSWAPQ